MNGKGDNQVLATTGDADRKGFTFLSRVFFLFMHCRLDPDDIELPIERLGIRCKSAGFAPVVSILDRLTERCFVAAPPSPLPWSANTASRA